MTGFLSADLARRSLCGLVLIAAWVGAFALRLPQLQERPMHTDESVHAIKFQGLWDTGIYRYDPNEYHGPSLYYLTYPVAVLDGLCRTGAWDERTLRLVPALFGIGLLLLLPLVRDGLGFAALCWAALFTALSPAMAYYSRYYIHEMLLVFFTFLALASGWRYYQNPRTAWAGLAGFAIGLMFVTKETCVLNFIAFGLAITIIVLGRHFANRTVAGLSAPSILDPKSPTGPTQLDGKSLATPPRNPDADPLLPPQYRLIRHGSWALAAALIVTVILFSAFFTYGQGLLDSLKTYLPWTHRAAGESPHIHPWYFYFQRLLFFQQERGPLWTEILIFGLALVGITRAWLNRPLAEGQLLFGRLISLYTIILAVLYCVIPYKTPWCLLGFWHGMILMAGVGATVVLAWRPGWIWTAVSSIVLLLAAGQLAAQATRTCFLYSADPRNPYVYSHTSPDLLELVDRVKELTKMNPDPEHQVIKVMAIGGDYWPLPWYLRNAPHVGWYSHVPEDPRATMVIASARFANGVREKSGGTLASTGFFGLRPVPPRSEPDRLLLQLWVETNLWRTFLESRVTTP